MPVVASPFKGIESQSVPSHHSCREALGVGKSANHKPRKEFDWPVSIDRHLQRSLCLGKFSAKRRPRFLNPIFRRDRGCQQLHTSHYTEFELLVLIYKQMLRLVRKSWNHHWNRRSLLRRQTFLTRVVKWGRPPIWARVFPDLFSRFYQKHARKGLRNPCCHRHCCRLCPHGRFHIAFYSNVLLSGDCVSEAVLVCFCEMELLKLSNHMTDLL
jgi:hypothetical protein